MRIFEHGLRLHQVQAEREGFAGEVHAGDGDARRAGPQLQASRCSSSRARRLKVTWSPDLGAERVYRVLGAKGLGGATTRGASGTSAGAEWAWEVVTEETKGGYNFFKVVVGMP